MATEVDERLETAEPGVPKRGSPLGEMGQSSTAEAVKKGKQSLMVAVTHAAVP